MQRPGGSLTLGGSDFRYDIDKAGKLVTLYSEEAVSGHAIVAAIDALQQAFPGHTVLLNPFVEQTAPSIEAIAAWPSRAIPAD